MLRKHEIEKKERESWRKRNKRKNGEKREKKKVTKAPSDGQKDERKR